ncbi:hypothetical protein OG204_09755 [Streptomyces sp. NBC_01387]|uniref:hypothetical protein n=1 Tax=unclassified Streptomyces TaxID=2593676 RepID=UPI0020257773|nr:MULTISPECIES: hypothetical protein [unclassified Streptomyces]MCX4551425.1 hypothetical protein [Streptomyces sp. NBC_01500]WSC22818.1 hypothetical protein OIE60_25865 [Streptomyces sp. NBC_01766]WSV56730.1 hypothetical protein OG282_25285 [Streptomyces sp. NBC_01014]
MSEARTDTARTRPQPATAGRGEAGGSGKHRGSAAPTEASEAETNGRHRRAAEQRTGAA